MEIIANMLAGSNDEEIAAAKHLGKADDARAFHLLLARILIEERAPG